METEVHVLHAQLERYRRLLRTMTNEEVIRILEQMIRETQQRLDEIEKHTVATLPSGDKGPTKRSS
jgi:hypothetical protein